MRLTQLVIVWIIALATTFQGFAQGEEAFAGQPERIDISKSVHLFPNPAVDFVHIRVESFRAQDVSLSLHNIIGNQVSIESEIVNDHEIRVRVKDLDAGYYLLGLKDKASHYRGTFKFVKK